MRGGMIMSKALATYFATVNDIPDTEFEEVK